MFSYLSKVLFSGFFPVKDNFVNMGQNNSKQSDVSPLTEYLQHNFIYYSLPNNKSRVLQNFVA